MSEGFFWTQLVQVMPWVWEVSEVYFGHSLFRSCLRCGKCQRVFPDTACSGHALGVGSVIGFVLDTACSGHAFGVGSVSFFFPDTACSGHAWGSGDVQMFSDFCTRAACVVWMLYNFNCFQVRKQTL